LPEKAPDDQPLKILGESRRGETIDVARSGEWVDFVSHGSVLEDCRIVIHGSARSFVFAGATFRRCTIVAKRRLSNVRWTDVILDRCVLRGTCIGNEWGARPEAHMSEWRGGLAECDLRGAKLHLCEFYRCDLRSVALPRWPFFTILDPSENASDWLALPFTGRARIMAEVVVAARPGHVGSTLDGTILARDAGLSIEALRDLLAGRPYIVGMGQ
jgi:hypothetical protein